MTAGNTQHTNRQQTDIAIVGGGMVGISLALMLARALPTRHIHLIEAFPLSPPQVNNHPSQSKGASFDARSTALSASSRQIFEHLSLWEHMQQHCTAINRVHVSERGKLGSTQLSAVEQNLPALGYVVENAGLGNVLLSGLQTVSNVTVLAPTKVTKVQPLKAGMQLFFEDQQVPLNTTLLVVADGAESATCAMLGIHSTKQAYRQHGLIANVQLGQPHQGVAYERFTDQGPIALLPLQSLDNQPRAALVWTLPDEQASRLLDCDEALFIKTLNQRFGYRLGTFASVGKRYSYPLQLTLASEQVRRNLVVVGNAAHSLHPVAGQGFNLALRDCARLTEQLIGAQAEGVSLGELEVLQGYTDAQRNDQQRTILLSDLLPKTFALKNPAVAIGRSLSLLAMDASPTLRNSFANLGMGLLGKSPQLSVKSPQL